MTQPAPNATAREVNPRLVLLLCSGATFMAFLDLSVVNIAFPALMEHFRDTALTTLTWVVSGYAVMFAALLTPAGRLADSIGRTKVFLGSLLGFVLASVACGIAPNAEWLISARFVQGATAAGMIPAALGLVMAATPREHMFRALGAWSAAAGFSAVVGPVIGGLLIHAFSWRSVFYINAPIGVLLLLASLRGLPRHQPAAGSRRPDALGTVTVALAVGAVVTALTEGDGWGWTDPRTLGMFAAGAVLAAFSLLRSRTHPSPAIDISVWRSRTYAASNLVAAVLGMSMFAWLLAGAVFAVGVWRYSILQAAGALSVGAVASMVTSVAAGRATKPTTRQALVVVGLLLFTACTLMMSTDLFDTVPRFWSAWVPSGILGGGGLGLAATGLSSISASALPPQRFAAGIGMTFTARQVGGALGTAGLAAIFAAHHGASVAAFHDLYRACTAATLVAAIAAIWLRQAATPAAARTEAGVTPQASPVG